MPRLLPELVTNCHIASMEPRARDERGALGLIADAAMVWQGSTICWLGPRKELPGEFASLPAIDAGGTWITPGLIDCHTHLVWAGNRALEFEQRLRGTSYAEIAAQGGGIVSTVRATRAASQDELLTASRKRLLALMDEGVTTIEIKSGYGLELSTERKILQVARLLGQQLPVTVSTTFLGAHALPPEFKAMINGGDLYVDAVLEMLRLLHAEGLVDAVDAFCETIGFTPAQILRVFEFAQTLGLAVKLHAEQLSDSGGASLAAAFNALSCDHLEWLSADGSKAMAASGSVAVLLPAAFYFLRETRLPPIDLLRKDNVPIALATDCNPGSSPCTSLLLILNMGCTLFRLTPSEALLGVTRHAAKAMGFKDRGYLAVGRRADFILWDIHHPVELCYAFGANPRVASVQNGHWFTDLLPNKSSTHLSALKKVIENN